MSITMSIPSERTLAWVRRTATKDVLSGSYILPPTTLSKAQANLLQVMLDDYIPLVKTDPSALDLGDCEVEQILESMAEEWKNRSRTYSPHKARALKLAYLLHKTKTTHVPHLRIVRRLDEVAKYIQQRMFEIQYELNYSRHYNLPHHLFIHNICRKLHSPV